MNARSFEIHLAEMADYPHLLPLMEADFAMHSAALPRHYKKGKNVNYDKEKFQALLNGPESSVWVATQNNDVVGLASAIVREAPESLVTYQRRFTEIEYVSVKEAVRRMGIGRALVEACIEWAREQKTDSIHLSVFAFSSAALEFYRSVGFSTLYHRMNLPIAD